MKVYVIVRREIEDTDVFEVWSGYDAAKQRVEQLNNREESNTIRPEYEVQSFVVL